MKAQSYYRCENCGRIAARDAGKRLSCCPDCGGSNVKILVPVDNEMQGDPLSGRKKIAMATLIGLAGVASVAVFLLFGRLLQGYMTFDAGREAAQKAHERLSAEIKAQEARFSSLTMKIAESEEKNSTLADKDARFAVLTNQTLFLEAERSQILKTLKTANMELASATGTVVGLVIEIEALKRQKVGLIEDVDLANRELEKREAEVQKLSDTVRQTEASASFGKAMLEETRKILQDQWLTLSNEAAKVVGVRTKLAGLENEMTRMRRKVDSLEADDARLSSAIDAAVSRTNRLAAAVADAEKASISAVAELAKTQAALDAAHAARDKAREDAELQMARVVSLAARKDAIDNEIRDRENGKAALDAAVAELKKQQALVIAESAKVRAELDALNATRDKSREEADEQSARAAALKVEIISMEKAMADAEKAKGVPEK